jgi:hypothetical protein
MGAHAEQSLLACEVSRIRPIWSATVGWVSAATAVTISFRPQTARNPTLSDRMGNCWVTRIRRLSNW